MAHRHKYMAGFAVRVPTRVSSRSSEDHDSNYGSSMASEPEPSYNPEPSELFCRPTGLELEPLSKPVPFVKLNLDENSMLFDSTYVPETPSYCESDDLSYKSRAGGTKHSHPLSHNHAPVTVGSSPYISFEPWEGFPLFHEAHVPDASKAIPKYLFRMWTPRGGLVPHHQSASGIIPSGHKEGKGHQSMYDMLQNHDHDARMQGRARRLGVHFLDLFFPLCLGLCYYRKGYCQHRRYRHRKAPKD